MPYRSLPSVTRTNASAPRQTTPWENFTSTKLGAFPTNVRQSSRKHFRFLDAAAGNPRLGEHRQRKAAALATQVR